MRRRLLTSLVVVVAALATSACGNKEPETLHGTTEGAYLDLDGMKYQVQISRQLNPASIEDRDYLIGLPPAARNLPPGQEWFAVFVRVENDGDKASKTATDYEITDTLDRKFRPVRFAPDNVFAYRGGGVLKPKAIIPAPDSPPGQGSIQGSLLLFRIPTRNLENRPLELSIASTKNPSVHATVDLDV
jgi:hypothetical protein